MEREVTTETGEEGRASATSEAPPSDTPSRIGKYEVEAEIGKGTLVKLFRALDRDTGRPVTLKVMTEPRHRRLVEVFRREVATAARLSHRNLIAIYELGEHAGLPFAAMQALPGGDLRQAIQTQSHLALLQKVAIMWQVAEGLSAAHRGGLFYVGLRPSGISLAEDGSAAIQDFSIVRLIGEDQTEDESYASPEELKAGLSPDALSDVFAFGTIYYELLTGVHPYRNGSPAPLRSLAPECPEALERLVERALDLNRERRYQSMDEVQDDAGPIVCELKRARAAALLAGARRSQETGQLEQAESVLREVLELDPDNRNARRMRVGLRAGEQRRVVQERVRGLLQEAEEEAAAHRFARAVDILHSAAQLEGSGPEVTRRLQEMCARLEQSQNAAQLLADARQLLVEGRFPEAHEKAAAAHALDPDRPETAELLAAIAQAAPRRDQEAHDDASSIQTAAPERQLRLEREKSEIRSLIAEELFADAVARLIVLAGEFPADSVLPDLLAQARAGLMRTQLIANLRTSCACLRTDGEFEKARAALDAALTAHAGDPAILALQRQLEQEWQAFQTAAGIRLALAEAQFLLSQDRPHLAVKFLREKSAALPDQPELLARIAAIEQTIPDWEKRRFVQDSLDRAAVVEQSGQWSVALAVIEQALETSPTSPELQAAAARLSERRREDDLRKKLARRLEAIQQKIGAEAWMEALSLIESAQAEFPAEPELEQRLEAVRTGRRRAESNAIAAKVRQYLNDGDPEKAEEVLRKAMETQPGVQAPEGLWKEVETGKRDREQWRTAQALFARRQFREAEEILTPLATRNLPDAQVLLQAVRAARASSEKDELFERGREQALKLIEQQQFAQAAGLIRNLLTTFPGDPILARDLQLAEAGLPDGGAIVREPSAPPVPEPKAAAPSPSLRIAISTRAGWLPYLLWPAIGASLVVLLVSASGTLWKVTRPEAHAAAPVTQRKTALPPRQEAPGLPDPDSQEPAIQEPIALSRPAPTIPALAVQRGISGMVRLEATVDQTGAVTATKVLSGDAVLASAARSAVSNWRYVPGMRNGRPVATKVQILISFESPK